MAYVRTDLFANHGTDLCTVRCMAKCQPRLRRLPPLRSLMGPPSRSAWPLNAHSCVPRRRRILPPMPHHLAMLRRPPMRLRPTLRLLPGLARQLRVPPTLLLLLRLRRSPLSPLAYCIRSLALPLVLALARSCNHLSLRSLARSLAPPLALHLPTLHALSIWHSLARTFSRPVRSSRTVRFSTLSLPSLHTSSALDAVLVVSSSRRCSS